MVGQVLCGRRSLKFQTIQEIREIGLKLLRNVVVECILSEATDNKTFLFTVMLTSCIVDIPNCEHMLSVVHGTQETSSYHKRTVVWIDFASNASAAQYLRSCMSLLSQHQVKSSVA